LEDKDATNALCWWWSAPSIRGICAICG